MRHHRWTSAIGTFVLTIGLISCSGAQRAHSTDNPSLDDGAGSLSKPAHPGVHETSLWKTQPSSVISTDVHPHDLPLGIWDIWSPSDWEYAVSLTQQGEDNLLDIEFTRLSGLNATFIVNGIVNEKLHVNAYNRGLLQPGVTLASMVQPDDSAYGYTQDKRIPGNWPFRVTYNNVITRFVTQADLDDPAVRETAYAVLDGIVDSQIEAYGDDIRATPFYLVLKEGWERGQSMENNHHYSMLFEHVVNRIREHDRERSIIYFGSYKLQAYREAFQPERIADPALSDSFFTGRLMRGWNVFNNELYPFPGKKGDREWILKNYAGRYYYRNMIINYTYWLRDLTRQVERYAEAVRPIGPHPEWWQDIQVIREERIQPDSTMQFEYRRPTRHEYAMHAYLALANGARGITLWSYKGSLLMWPYKSMNGDQLESQRPMRIFYPHKKNFNALVSSDWTPSGTSGKPASFRKPFSEAEGNPDYFPEGTEFEPYPGEHYPYDRIAILYANLHGLLPELRALRWWWATDGIDNSFIDIAGNRGELRFKRLSIHDWMKQLTPVHDGVSLGERFRLRAITNDDDGPVEGKQNSLASNIYVGMFDDPAYPEYEMYLVVNMTCNDIVDDYIVPATEESVPRLVFEGDDPLEATILWQDVWRDMRPLSSEKTMAGERVSLDIPLYPGDTKLIRVRSR